MGKKNYLIFESMPPWTLQVKIYGGTLAMPINGDIADTFIPFITELMEIAGVKEVFEKYGAEWKRES